MSFASDEYSVHSGEPVELYEFSRSDLWRYKITSAREGFTPVGSNDFYEAEPISRSKIDTTDDVLKVPITITLPISNTLVNELLHFTPEMRTTLTIKKLHRTNNISEALVMWKGRIVSVEPKNTVADIHCEPILSSISMSGLGIRYEFVCQHLVYGQGCGVSKVEFEQEEIIASVISNTHIEVQNTYTDGYFTGGIAEIPLQYKTSFITNHVGNTLYLARPLYDVSFGDTIFLYPGCDKTPQTCSGRFNNILNYLAFNWVPNKNPFLSSIRR
jgi:hypothetical protein